VPVSHRVLYGIYVVVWLFLAIDPKHFDDWLLENVLVFVLFPTVILLDRRYSLSFFSIFLLLIFASLHSLGAHYTYAEMKHFNYITNSFGFERNHFDRVVHFCFGLLIFKAIFEIVLHYISSIKISILFTASIVISIAAIYEILEWFAAITFKPELGIAFLGTQGDIWDAQQDIFVAVIGVAINMVLLYFIYRQKKRVL
jgi:putative membrane protein